MKQMTESTKRALRTALQAVGAFAAFLVAVAIPPIGDAVNGVLDLVGVDVEVTPGLIGAIGVVGASLVALVTKLQNVLEGRDKVESVQDLADTVQDLTAVVEALYAAGQDVGEEFQKALDARGVKVTVERDEV